MSKKIQAALATITAYLTETYEKADNHGVVEVKNAYQVPLDRVLGSICWNLQDSVNYQIESTDRSREIAKRVRRSHNGTEISEKQLEAALDWIVRNEDKLAHLEKFRDLANTAYADAVGKPFMFVARRAQVGEANGPETPEQVRFRKLMGNVNNEVDTQSTI